MRVKRIERALCTQHFDATMADVPEKTTNPLGDAGNAVSENIKSLRERRRMTFVELSARLDDAGRPIPVLGLRRIERGERRVDVDDLYAFAQVFKVSPLELVAPAQWAQLEKLLYDLLARTAASGDADDDLVSHGLNIGLGMGVLTIEHAETVTHVYRALRPKREGAREAAQEALKASFGDE